MRFGMPMLRKLLLYTIVFLGSMFLLLPAAWSQAAPTLNYGQPASGSLDAGQHIDYSFAGKVGDQPIITLNAHGGSLLPVLELRDPQGHLIGQDSGSGEKGNALLKGLVLALDGMYTVTAINKATSGTGKYGLLINEAKSQIYFDGVPTVNQSG